MLVDGIVKNISLGVRKRLKKTFKFDIENEDETFRHLAKIVIVKY